MSLDSLMPESFGPDSLLPKDYPLLLAQRDNKLVLLDTSEEICSDPEECPHLKCRALAAANKSYAPYSESPSGVALKCDDKVYRGWYLESVAYNPSLGPVQAALVDFVARSGGKPFEDITEAVLVEKGDATVVQEDTARIFLKKIAPNCDFKVLRCK
ncbi:PREDICTED: cytidine deaminase 6-like [Camelina sativa]|uniref:Cytidine deaminase 6-like n=1 Tax=Camelina sativa TaxID=90675 RepID=A0ABM1QME1_CAMSA|nr:PREDICTED: cytidine deaminase 6-like [Camelina sativa]